MPRRVVARAPASLSTSRTTSAASLSSADVMPVRRESPQRNPHVLTCESIATLGDTAFRSRSRMSRWLNTAAFAAAGTGPSSSRRCGCLCRFSRRAGRGGVSGRPSGSDGSDHGIRGDQVDVRTSRIPSRGQHWCRGERHATPDHAARPPCPAPARPTRRGIPVTHRLPVIGWAF